MCNWKKASTLEFPISRSQLFITFRQDQLQLKDWPLIKICKTSILLWEVVEFNLVLFRPKEKKLAELYRYVGLNYDERVMTSIVNEVVKSVVA